MKTGNKQTASKRLGRNELQSPATEKQNKVDLRTVDLDKLKEDIFRTIEERRLALKRPN